MSLEKNRRHAPRRVSVAYEEDKAWIGFYRCSGDPAVAAELIQHLDADPDLKRAHPALYLRCRQTVRRHQERQARAKRIGQFVRLAIGIAVAAPLRALRRALHLGRDIAVECLPETHAEPAVRRAKRLATESEFAHQREDFASQDGSTGARQAGDANGTEESRSPKAA